MLCTALGAVGLLVTAASLAQLVLAWIAMSLALHGLLVFRTERRGARLAARKKFLFARAGDLCLVAAAVLLARAFGTLDIPSLNAAAQAAAEAGTMPPGAAGAAVLIAVAALLKSAQFPTHGWLIEVMETPTPVSALLHAGIVNAGGFLILRFADLMLATASALPLLLVVGALTAVIGALAALVQTSIKVSLAWSTVAQMGFMMLQCGLGAFSSAILHLLAHSLYKAHAFLEAGRTVERVDAGFASTRNADTRDAPGLPMAVLTLSSVLLAYGGAAWMLGFTPVQKPAALVLGAVPMMGLWLAWISGPRSLRALHGLLPIAAGVMALYFFLQMASARIFAGLLPTTHAPGLLGTALLAVVFGAFVAAVLLQACAPGRSSALRVHLANGLYLNDVIDRLLGACRLRSDTRH
jgi:NAD(P)H-quinone oxidoreductase subunit 5